MKTFGNKKFTELKVLGHGTYGSVYKARRESDGNNYAVKIVNLSTLSQKEIEDSVNEIRIMASFTSPFIIRFYEAFIENKKLGIVTEYARLGDLAHLIERRKKQGKPLKENVIWCYFLQILKGLENLHSKGVIHRDLKSANILISAPDIVKIGDLGISTILETKQLTRTQIGTPLYLAPEIWKRRPYNHKCDMWSLGILLYEMMTFSYPFIGSDAQDLANRVCLGKFILPSRRYSNDLITIVRRLLQVNPLLRPSVKDLLNLQCVQQKMAIVDALIEKDIGVPNEKLLSTIRVPGNLKNINLPDPAYNKRANIVKPIDQRLHCKKGVPVHKKLNIVSSPELQMIADHDWWSPNRASTNLRQEKHMEIHEPAPIIIQENENQALYKKEINMPALPFDTPKRAPRRYIPPSQLLEAAHQEYINPRFKRIPIR